MARFPDPKGTRNAFARGLLVVAILLLAWTARPVDAVAYTVGSPLTNGCHEKLASAALRTVRDELSTAAPLPTSADERALIDDLQFNPPDDMLDLGAVTLLVSVRDNDLKGRGSGDLSSLVEIHGSPTGQEEHCLRSEAQKEPGGSQAAVDACRAFIRARVVQALDGLDAEGKPDLAKRTLLRLQLSLRGAVEAPLPTYYVRIGQAMHTLEDSFSHAYRTPDGMQITVALNWIDFVNGTLEEARDGPPHIEALDRCDDPDAARKNKRELATSASAELLRATLDPLKAREEKLAAVDEILDRYMSFSPGCTSANRWCDAAENHYQAAAGCGCSSADGTGGTSALIAAVTLALSTARRRNRRRRNLSPMVASTLVLSGVLFSAPARARAVDADEPSAASADPPPPSPPPATTTKTVEPGSRPETPASVTTTVTTPEVTTTTVTAPTKPNPNAPPPPVIVPVKEPGPRDPNALAFGGSLAVSGAIDKAALAFALGARLRLSKHWTVGVDGEWNPWIALNGTPIRAGAFNFYGTGILRFPLAYENFNLRTTLSLGGSAQLTTLFGAPSGSVGLYVGASPLGLEWKVSRAFFLVMNPFNIAVPVPHLTGVPLVYPQYRLTLGIEVYSG